MKYSLLLWLQRSTSLGLAAATILIITWILLVHNCSCQQNISLESLLRLRQALQAKEQETLLQNYYVKPLLTVPINSYTYKMQFSADTWLAKSMTFTKRWQFFNFQKLWMKRFIEGTFGVSSFQFKHTSLILLCPSFPELKWKLCLAKSIGMTCWCAGNRTHDWIHQALSFVLVIYRL